MIPTKARVEFDHVTPILIDVHWRLVRKEISFKAICFFQHGMRYLPFLEHLRHFSCCPEVSLPHSNNLPLCHPCEWLVSNTFLFISFGYISTWWSLVSHVYFIWAKRTMPISSITKPWKPSITEHLKYMRLMYYSIHQYTFLQFNLITFGYSIFFFIS